MTEPKSFVPAPLKDRLTAHSPVVVPCEFDARPEVALLMSAPDTSTGPRMYLAAPSLSHVTRGSSSGADVTSSGAEHL